MNPRHQASSATLCAAHHSRDFDLASKKKSDFLVSMDMHEDSVIIIDAVGTILMISQVRVSMSTCRACLHV